MRGRSPYPQLRGAKSLKFNARITARGRSPDAQQADPEACDGEVVELVTVPESVTGYAISTAYSREVVELVTVPESVTGYAISTAYSREVVDMVTVPSVEELETE